MANTIMPTVFASGVRRLKTLSGWPTLGASADIIEAMGAEHYDIASLVAAGATDAQLQQLWDTTEAGSREFAFAANQLLNVLTGKPGATGGAGYPAAAIPTTVSYGFQVYDLAQESAWNAISGIFSNTQQQLNALARSAPKDADVMQMVQDFNSLVGQYASYYQQAFGSAPSSIPLASIPTMSGLGIAPLVIIGGIAAAVAAVLAALYLLNQRIVAKAALIQAQGASQTTANVGTLSTTAQQQYAGAQAAYSAGNKALGDQLMASYNATLLAIQKVGAAPAATMNFSAWFQQNWGWLMLGLGAIIIVPSALKRR